MTRELRIARRARVVIDNDWAGDPDGLVALAHHLLAPGNVVEAVTSWRLSPIFGPNDGGAARGARLARELVTLVTPDGEPAPGVHAGSDAAFDPAGPVSGVAAGSPGAGASGASGATGAEASRAAGADTDAADAIVAAVRREDRLPLVVVCAGPLTNVAEALRRDPGIAGRFTLSWVGGTLASATAGGEYNLDTDRAAAEHALAAVGPALRRFPLETYRRCAWSVPQLEDVLTTQGGALGAWLWRRFLELPLPEEVEVDAVWPLGDSCPLVGTALSPESSDWRFEPDGSRACTRLDDRLVLGDLTALLRRHARQAARPQHADTDTAADLQTHPTPDGSPS